MHLNIREIVGLAPVMPVLTIADPATAVPLARALAAGGLHVLQFIVRTPAGLASVAAVRKAVPEAVVGVGALTRPAEFAAADRAGAQFGVTPGLTAELAAASRGARFPLLPGVMTPTEVIAARTAGFNVLALFPAHQAGGIEFLHALGAHFPDVLFCPAGGITRASAANYLALRNVACVAGDWLVPGAMLAALDWPGIEALARDAASLKRKHTEAT
jgi:2-dehydro-3-deoxyphosphogluconate aldolase/(4S)-4-hydroxy-2-oxoglutarate aldolase